MAEPHPLFTVRRHNRLRDYDFPMAWLFRAFVILATAFASLFAYVANEKLSTVKDISDKMPWLIGTTAGLQQQLNKSDQRIETLYNYLLTSNVRITRPDRRQDQ